MTLKSKKSELNIRSVAAQKQFIKTAFVNKNYLVREKLLGFVELMRPMEWSKSLLNMTIGLLIAFYVYFSPIDLWVFLAGFISVATLWSGLYALNDFTDWKIDALHKVKKRRAIPSGRVSPTQGLLFAGILLLISFSISFMLKNLLFGGCLLAMVVNQALYTMKPFRFKSRKVLDMVSGSMINPIFRYYSGVVLFVPEKILYSQVPPLLPLIFVVGVQLGGYLLYRLFSKKHDLKFKMKSTVALVSERKLKLISYAVLSISCFAYIGLFLNYLMPEKISFLGYLPLQYLAPLIIALCAVPFLKDAMKNPSKADMNSSYLVSYLTAIFFIIANLLIFILWP